MLRLSPDGSTVLNIGGEGDTVGLYDVRTDSHASKKLPALQKTSLYSQSGVFVAIYDDSSIHAFDLNGKLVSSLLVEQAVVDLQARPDFLLVVTGNSFLVLTFPGLKRVSVLDRPGPALCGTSLSPDVVLFAFRVFSEAP